MTAGGWVFMLGSLALVWGLSVWCFHRLLRQPPEAAADSTRDSERD